MSCFLLINCPKFLTFYKQNTVFKKHSGYCFVYCNISESATNIHIVSDRLWCRFLKVILYLEHFLLISINFKLQKNSTINYTCLITNVWYLWYFVFIHSLHPISYALYLQDSQFILWSIRCFGFMHCGPKHIAWK